MEVILFQPEIPQNTGNIARTCAVTGTPLTLVRPLGFALTEKHVKRAGLDYWADLSIREIEDLGAHLKPPFYFLSTKGRRLYTDILFQPGTQLVFGPETRGLPSSLLEAWPDQVYTIPMRPGARSLNLSNAVAIVLYEGLRQQGFTSLARDPV